MDWSFTPVPRVFEYFEDLSRIPHPSRHTKAVSDYCVRFAESRGLKYRQDEANNVIIWKAASPGREQDPAVMLQGHLDMVPAVEEGRQFDFQNDPLELRVEDGYLKAAGTTLGGDDGIAVAMCLAILDDDTLSHPPLICVFTTDEEIGMLGAAALDMSDLKADVLLNVDSEQEGVLTVSCAGGATVRLTVPVSTEEASGSVSRISLTGLTGGHSGAEIHKNRDNAIRVLARLLEKLFTDCPELGLVSVNGGSADNAIPSSASCGIFVPEGKEALLRAALADARIAVFEPVRVKEPGAELTLEENTGRADSAVPSSAAVKALSWIVSLPDGVQAMSEDVPGLVQTSCNSGILNWEGGKLALTISVRSCINEEKEELIGKLVSLVESAGGKADVSGSYPGWPARKNSPLTKLCVDVWKKQTGQDMSVEAIHAGLECGLFASGIPGLDCVSFGPDMIDIHTPRERLSVSSCGRIWDFVCGILEDIRR